MYNLGMKLNEYIRKLQIDSGLNVKEFVETHGFSQAQYYRYISEEYMKNITPLIASKICKALSLTSPDLYEFDDQFSDDFVQSVEEYLNFDSHLSYPHTNIKRFYENYLVRYGFESIEYDPVETIRNGSYIAYEGKNGKIKTRMPYLRSQPIGLFPEAIAKHSNGKEYVIIFFEPKHIAANTTIYDSKFHAVHLFLVWAVSQTSRVDHKYDNNFIFLTTSDYVFENVVDDSSSLNGFRTNEGADIYFGLCRKNRPFQCKKITNPQISDNIFTEK